MQRDWDAELIQDREFRIGGEVFEFIYPHWEQGALLFDETLEPETNGGFSFKADTELAISKIPLFLNPKNDAAKRFKALVARKTDPVPRHQLVQLYQWLVQVTSGLPTQAPSEPGIGDGASGTSSSAGTSSTAAAPSA